MMILKMYRCIFYSLLALLASGRAVGAFCGTQQGFRSPRPPVLATALQAWSNGSPKIPKSIQERDSQAIQSIKTAIEKPRDKSIPLVECEFPPIQNLNKLGDGSLRSANLVDQANLDFASKLISSLALPIPGFGPKVWLLTSTSATTRFLEQANALLGKKANVAMHSLQQGLPDGLSTTDLCVLVSPSSKTDYDMARNIATQKLAKSIVVVNALAKDQKSIPASATFAYHLKPLTYNSQTVGYLLRAYPKDWATMDLATNEVLATFTDREILVPKTNTPDLRESGKLVQRAVDQRAILARKQL